MARVFRLNHEILIYAPIERCFQLSTSLAIVEHELGMRPVPHQHPGRPPARTSGLVTGSDTVRWQGWQLGLPQVHESLIEAFNPPLFFRDRMIAGRFASFEHDHAFTQQGDGIDGALLQDEVRFSMPFGWAGALVGRLILEPHIRGLLGRRFRLLKRLAESEEWREYLPAQDRQPQLPSR
jgi:ligand-binding SRPBCC domain-containing protein